MHDILVTIPTYDECDNVRPISEAVFEVQPQCDMLFVDDNSPDGTGRVLDEMAAADKRVNVIHKSGKLGLGRAYITGFQWAVENNYRLESAWTPISRTTPSRFPT